MAVCSTQELVHDPAQAEVARGSHGQQHPSLPVPLQQKQPRRQAPRCPQQRQLDNSSWRGQGGSVLGALQPVLQGIVLPRGSGLVGLGMLLGKLLLVESTAVLQLRGHQPPAHVLCLLIQALLEVIAQDLRFAMLQWLQGRVLDVLRGHAAYPLQAGPRQLCLPLPKRLYFLLHALPADVLVDPFPEGPVEVGVDFPVQPVPVLYLLHDGVREGGLGAAVPDVEWEGDDAVQVPAQHLLQQHHGLVEVLGDEEQVEGRLNGLQHELHPLG